MIAYKFMKRKYAEKFAQGEINISPAHIMRQSDGFDDGRSDPNELIANGHVPGGMLTLNTRDNKLLDDMVTIVRAGKKVHSEWEMHGEAVSIVDDALIFCASAEMNSDLERKMEAKFGADAVYRISNFQLFSQRISTEIFLPEVKCIVDKVKYSDEIRLGVEAYLPVDPFAKRTSYSWQKELRAVWCLENIHSSFTVQVPSLIELLTQIK